MIPVGYDCDIWVHYRVTNNITLNSVNINEWTKEKTYHILLSMMAKPNLLMVIEREWHNVCNELENQLIIVYRVHKHTINLNIHWYSHFEFVSNMKPAINKQRLLDGQKQFYCHIKSILISKIFQYCYNYYWINFILVRCIRIIKIFKFIL